MSCLFLSRGDRHSRSSSPLEGKVAAQRSMGGQAEGFLHRFFNSSGFARFTPSLTLPPLGGGKSAASNLAILSGFQPEGVLV